MTLADRLGTVRFYQNLGQPYSQMLREAVKPALGMTAVSSYLGGRVSLAITLGVATFVALVVLEIVFGYVVATYRIYHAQVAAERDQNPVTLKILSLLEHIEFNTHKPVWPSDVWRSQEVR